MRIGDHTVVVGHGDGEKTYALAALCSVKARRGGGRLWARCLLLAPPAAAAAYAAGRWGPGLGLRLGVPPPLLQWLPWLWLAPAVLVLAACGLYAFRPFTVVLTFASGEAESVDCGTAGRQREAYRQLADALGRQGGGGGTTAGRGG